MNDDAISRKAAIDAIEEYFGDLPIVVHYDMLQLIKKLSSAERRGRWIRTGEDGYCSVCKCDMPMFRNDWEWEYTETSYCPNCGAKMDDNWEEPAINPCRGCEDYGGRGGCISKGGCGAKMEGEEK